MQKREKIIVIITIIAALYGVIDFLLSHHAKTATPADSSVGLQLNSKLAAISSPDNKRLRDLANQINKPWRNVFARQALAKKSPAADKPHKDIHEELSVRTQKLHFSGYLEMGKNKIAIINQHDYLVGEIIDGFKVQEITPVAVQLSQSGFTFTILSQSLPGPGVYSTKISPKTRE